MSEPEAVPQVDTRHYMALCAFCLAVIFLVQLQAGIYVINLLSVLVGAMALLSKLRVGPLLLAILISLGQMRRILPGLILDVPQSHSAMNALDVMLCAAVLGYVAGHYRLQSIWSRVLPVDTRQRLGPPRRDFWLRLRPLPAKEARPAAQITAQEIAWLIISLPIWAVVGQAFLALLPREEGDLRLPVPLMQLLTIVWLLAVGFAVVATFLGYLKHRNYDGTTAQMYLQDQLWRDTCGEQRRVNRWLSWWMKKKK